MTFKVMFSTCQIYILILLALIIAKIPEFWKDLFFCEKSKPKLSWLIITRHRNSRDFPNFTSLVYSIEDPFFNSLLNSTLYIKE